MYFIVEGELEVDVSPQPVILRNGNFFGEMALIAHGDRTATVTAATPCQLLSLQALDLANFLDNNPELRETLSRVDDERRQATQSDAPSDTTDGVVDVDSRRAAGSGR